MPQGNQIPPAYQHTAFPPSAAARFGWVYWAGFLPMAVVAVYLQVFLSKAGFTKPEIGLLQGTLGLTTMLAPPLWGYVSDRIGRPRVVLAVAVLLRLPAFLLIGSGNSLAAATGAVLVFGFFSSPILPLVDGLTFRYIHDRGGDYGKVRALGSVGFIAAVGGMELLGVGDQGDVRLLIIAAVMVTGVHHAVSLIALPRATSSVRPGSYRPDLRVLLQRGFVLLTLAAVLGRMAMMSYYHFFTLFVKESLGFSQAGWLWVIGPISEVPMIYFSGWMIRRIGVRSLFLLGLIGTAVRLVGYVYVTSVWQLVPLQLLHALTFGAFFVAGVTYVSRLVRPEMKSSAQTIFAGLAFGLGSLMGGALGGQILRIWRYDVLYLVFAAIAALGVVVALMLPRDNVSNERLTA